MDTQKQRALARKYNDELNLPVTLFSDASTAMVFVVDVGILIVLIGALTLRLQL